ncbi:MAG: sulfotransferase family 2 domain-containing protein [Cyanobacteriota bacterium]|nr:sulfotransferase family 2 domain-containing protein [Cyanobacteriota bacterium]
MPFVGLHIHKTAGTSLLRYLEEAAPLRLYGAYSLRNFRLLEQPLWASQNLTSRDIFWGHSIYESFFYDLSVPTRLFTFLRDPQERILSWFNMLKRRKKLKKAGLSLEEFALAHDNSMCAMLVSRFPSLIGDPTARLSEQAMNVLNQMSFVGFQSHFDQHLPILLELMNISVRSDLLKKRHNIARSPMQISKADQDSLAGLNEEDHLLYAKASERYIQNPLNPERKVDFHNMVGISEAERSLIKKKQTKSAQRKYISSLRFSLGDAGVEEHVKIVTGAYANCSRVLDKLIGKPMLIMDEEAQD